jgi:hypothetical protein
MRTYQERLKNEHPRIEGNKQGLADRFGRPRHADQLGRETARSTRTFVLDKDEIEGFDVWDQINAMRFVTYVDESGRIWSAFESLLVTREEALQKSAFSVAWGACPGWVVCLVFACRVASQGVIGAFKVFMAAVQDLTRPSSREVPTHCLMNASDHFAWLPVLTAALTESEQCLA